MVEQKGPEGASKNLISIAIIVVALVIAGAIVLGVMIYEGVLEKGGPAAVVQPQTPPSGGKPPLEVFAECLGQKGMKFYGASWCGWCQKEKELFGEAAKYLPYIECIDASTNQLTSECQKEGISGFPTWQLPDGTKSPGFKTLEELTELSGCQL